MMSAGKIIGMIVAGMVAAVVAFVVMLLLIKLLWAWTIPDLMPGAVEQGLIARSISWLAAAKLALLVAVLLGIAGGRKEHR